MSFGPATTFLAPRGVYMRLCVCLFVCGMYVEFDLVATARLCRCIYREATAYARRRTCHERALTNSVKRLMELRTEAAQMFRSGPQGSMLAFSDPCLLARLPKSAEAVTFSYSSRIETQTSEFANYLVEAYTCSTAVPVEIDTISVTSARTWTSFE